MLFAQAQRVPAKRERLRLKGYGKLCERVTQRCCASLTAARRAHVRAPDFAIRVDDQHPRGLTIRHARGHIDLHRWCQSSRQHIGAFHGIPTAGAERAGIFDKHHHADPLHEKAFRVVQGYGKLSNHRIADRASTSLGAAGAACIRDHDFAVRTDTQSPCRLTIVHDTTRVKPHHRPQTCGNHVSARCRIPAAATNRATKRDQHHESASGDRESFTGIQGYGKLYKLLERHPLHSDRLFIIDPVKLVTATNTEPDLIVGNVPEIRVETFACRVNHAIRA